MMTEVEVTCKHAKFQPSWLKLSLKGISLGGTFFFLIRKNFCQNKSSISKCKYMEKTFFLCLENFSLFFAVELSLWKKDCIYVSNTFYFMGKIYFVQVLGKKKTSLHFPVIQK